MIKADFYPTRYTAIAGEYTDSAWTLANSGEYTPENFANPYMMGYIPAQEVPVPLMISNATVDGDGADAVIHFRRANNETVLWGLSMAYGSNGASWDGDHFYYSTNNATWTRPKSLNTYSSYFINKAEVINYQNSGYYEIEYVSVKHNQDDTWSDGTINSLFKVYKNAEQIRKFIAGEENWTLQIAGQNTVDVNYSMVNDYGMLEYDGGDYTIYFCFYGITQQGGASSCAVSLVGGRGSSMVPFFKFSATNANTEDATICFTASSAPGHFGGVSYNSSTHTVSSSSLQPAYNGMFLGFTDGDLPVSEIPSRANYKVYNQFFMYGSGIMSAIPLTEAYKFICIPNKFYKNATSFGNVPASASYNEDYTVALFNKSNIPLWTRVSGSFASILPKLQTWQYPGTDISENDFDPEHIIPPSPGGDTPPDEPQDLPHDEGEPTDDQDSRTLTAPTCFITQYAMGYSQLQTVGVNLWTSWLTPNLETWKNFFFAFAEDTGTLDIGAALNFIISLRVFPFSLASMTTDYISPTNGVYMGTGHTNFCPNASNLFRLNTVIGYLDCGTCEVVPKTPYNDFRDMYNCSVLCFLPYCGTVELTPAEVIGRTLHVKYHIDFQSGACTALVKVVGDTGEYTVASKSGQIGFTLPVTATNAGQLSAQFAKDATQTMGTIGGFYFKAGRALADNLSSPAEAFTSKPKAITASDNGNKSLNTFSNNTFETATEIGEAGFNAALSIANQALDMLSRSGIDVPAISGGMGAESMMQPDCCFVQIRRGKYAKPVNYPHSQGYINGSSNTISYYRGMFQGTPTYPNSNNKGLCKFTGVDSTGLTCHEDERAEIIALLESGVYL